MSPLVEVVAEVQARVSYLRCSTTADEAQGWVPCAALIGDPGRLRREIDATAAGRHTDDPQVAASLYVQSYAFRMPSIAVAAYALGLAVPSTSPATTAIRITRHRPGELAITDPICGPTSAEELASELFDQHLVPFVASVRIGTRIGELLLWGNVAASIATIFRAVESCGRIGDAVVRERAVQFEKAAAPWLSGLGSYSTIETEHASGWFWDRTNCCLWYQTSEGSYCDDCSLHHPLERTARRRADLTGSATS